MNKIAYLRFCLAALAAFCCAAGSLAQSSPAPAPAPPMPAPAYREVVDEVGRTVRIPQPVHRIVSLAPSLTETVYALGLQDRLVGDTDYCDYPPEAQKKTKVGSLMNPSLEQIVSLHPDLVLMVKGPNRIETVHSLDDLGVSAYAIDPHNLDEIVASTRKLADILGVPEVGASAGANLQNRLDALQRRLGDSPPKHVLFVVWTQPLISIGKNTFIADALRHAGAVSVVDSGQDWPQVNLEEMARLQPDFLVFADSHSEPAAREMEMLATLPGWRVLDAVSNRRYAVISDAVNRPAPRIVSAIEDLARQLHPEAFVEKPVDTNEKMEKQNPSPRLRPSQLASFAVDDSPRLIRPTLGGCSCAL